MENSLTPIQTHRLCKHTWQKKWDRESNKEFQFRTLSNVSDRRWKATGCDSQEKNKIGRLEQWNLVKSHIF